MRKHTAFTHFLLVVMLIILGATRLDRVSLKLLPETSIWLTGTSDDFPWSCSVEKAEGALTFDSVTDGKKLSAVGVPGVTVTVPVKALSCGHPQADKDLQRAMKAEANPEIRFDLVTSKIAAGEEEGEFTVHATGRVQAAGAERTVPLVMQGELMEDGRIQFRGEVPLSMADFGVEAPSDSKLTALEEFIVNIYAVAGPGGAR